MTVSGIRTVAKQEFRVRIRTGRWRWLLVSWVVVIGVFAGLLRVGLVTANADGPAGIPLFGGVMLFVLALALLVAPALTAQSITGDRERGTLATVQVTRLSASEIVVGKLVAAWGTGVVFLALTLPFVVWAIIEGGVGVGKAAFVMLIVTALVGVVCAVSQALSALFARGITATLMSYLLVFALTVGTPIVFALAMALTVTEDTEMLVPASSAAKTAPAAKTQTVTRHEPHPEYVWWLLAPNPFAVLADSAPEPPLRWDSDSRTWQPQTELDPLSLLGYAVRETRMGPADDVTGTERYRDAPAVWPYGLGFDVLLGAGSVWISVGRMRTPARRLSPGVRIA